MKGFLIGTGLLIGGIAYARFYKKVQNRVEEEFDSRDELIELQTQLIDECFETIRNQNEFIKSQKEVSEEINKQIKRINREFKKIAILTGTQNGRVSLTYNSWYV